MFEEASFLIYITIRQLKGYNEDKAKNILNFCIAQTYIQ